MELSGHFGMKITQEYYGKVVQKRVSEEINKIVEIKPATLSQKRGQ